MQKHQLNILLCVFAGCMACTSVVAQGFYSNGAIVSIAPQTILSLPDSMVNKGTLINNGSMIISGAWINTGTYEPAAGQIDFDSDLDQVINHNAQSIEKLVISGGGDKEFLANITIMSELSLESGVLISKNGARLIMNKGVSVVGGNDASHIVGSVERQGTGDWLFPVGNGVRYSPLTIIGVDKASSTGIVTLQELTAGQTLTGELDLARVSAKRYWQLAVTGDELTGAKVQLAVVDEDDLNVDTNLVTVAGSNAPTGPYANMSSFSISGDLSSGTVTSEKSPTYKYYAVAAIQEDKEIEVFNAVSAGSDGKNDFMTIRNIQFYPENRVVIHNRWGDRVFETSGYDNAQKCFKGLSDNGNKLPSGTYFYSIELGNGSKPVTGFMIVR